MKLFLILIVSTYLNAEVVTRMQVIMATIVTIKVNLKNEKYIENAFSIMKKIDASLSSYKNNSIISMLNKNKKVNLDNLSFEALTLSKRYYQESDEYFNITIGTITKDLYRFGVNESIPSNKELADAKVSFEGLIIRQKEAILSKGIKIDLGGIGKGFGIDKVSEYLLSKNVHEAIISASGDIRCHNSCHIDVQDPFSESMMLSFQTKNQNLGITTSGNYRRYVKDKKHNHLINPKTKQAQQNFASITLVSDMKSSALDAYATAVSVMPKEKAYAFLDKLNVGYIVVEVDKKTLVKPAGFFELR